MGGQCPQLRPFCAVAAQERGIVSTGVCAAALSLFEALDLRLGRIVQILDVLGGEVGHVLLADGVELGRGLKAAPSDLLFAQPLLQPLAPSA
jgi:hypothetical protein